MTPTIKVGFTRTGMASRTMYTARLQPVKLQYVTERKGLNVKKVIMRLQELKIVRTFDGGYAVKDRNGETLAVFDAHSEAVEWRYQYVTAVNTRTETLLRPNKR